MQSTSTAPQPETPNPKANQTSSTESVNLIVPVMKNTVSVEIHGFPIQALVDTGATISCVASSIITKLGIDSSKLQSIGVAEAVAVGGERHCSLGVVSLPVSFAGVSFVHNFQVFEKFHQPLIIGLDFLKTHEAIFNIAQNTLFIKDPDTHQAFSIDLQAGFAQVRHSVTIEPRSVTSVQIKIQNIPSNSLVLLEPSHLLP